MSTEGNPTPVRILVVDDEPAVEVLFQQRFRKEIREGQYEFIFAFSGLEAMDVLKANDTVDIVLTDINMPEMNGIEFLEQMKLMDHPTRKTIVISAYDDMVNIRAAMNRGAFDFITKPVSFQDLQITLEKTVTQVNLLKEAERMRSELERNIQRQHEQQREFSRELIKAQEDERRRIAGELHDSLGQQILVIRNRALMGLQDKRNEASSEHFTEIADIAAQTLDEVRSIAHNLRPYQLDRFGLTDAITAALDAIEKSSTLAIHRQLDNIDALLNDERQISFFRVFQECCTNALKHAQATELHVTIRKKDSGVFLQVEDNGVGMDLDRQAPSEHNRGFGLSGISERVKLLEGAVSIQSNPGLGTSITVYIP